MESGIPENKKQSGKCCGGWKPHCRINFDSMFYSLGKFLGTHPVISLAFSLAVCVGCSVGLVNWAEEFNDVELFMPRASRIRLDSYWVEAHFRDDMLYESIIVEADNVLDPAVLAAISDLEDTVKRINVSGHRWEDVCAGYLTWFQDETGSVNFNDSAFAEEIADTMKSNAFKNDCIYQSLLRLWSASDAPVTLASLGVEAILDDVTNALNSSLKQKNVLNDIGPLLSGIKRSSEGHVTGARATILNWMLKKADQFSPEWELAFIEQALDPARTLPPGMKVYAVATRSYNDILKTVMDNNMTVLFAGFSLIILYVIVMLGRCNLVEQRFYLSLLGVSVVGQSIMASYGLCFTMGFTWGPIHPVLPFLLLGIGVDNTFVIVQCLDNLSKKDLNLPIPERIGLALQQAGVSITVTSLTDILAFAVGTSTVMPFLRSFCLFAAMGIFFLYVFVLFFFVSCLAIDEYRLRAHRDGCIFVKHKQWVPNDCSQKNTQRMVFSKYVGPFLMKYPVKIFVVLLTIVVFCVNVWWVLKVEQKFDPIWYLNPDSFPIQYNNKLIEYFPQYGKRAGIYISGVNYYSDKEKLTNFMTKLNENPYINRAALDCWFVAYDRWLESKGLAPEDEDEFKSYLTEFLLLSKEGQAYVKDIKFSTIPFNEYNITTSMIPFQYIMINTTLEQVTAINSIQDLIRNANFTPEEQHVVAYSSDYVAWTANKIIGEELLRNLGITIAAVATVTMLLIQNLRTTVWVNCCLVLTVVDLVGSMYWLNLTIEISTSIMVLLCAGLAIDYAAHIGHEFTRLPGTRDERAIETLGRIGSAVFNGGVSTFLAFVLLGTSSSYIFTTFFKLFTGVVVFGLYHSLIFLPVILSLFGPDEPSPSNRHDQHPYAAASPYDIEVNGFLVPPPANRKQGIVISKFSLSSKQDARETNGHQNGTKLLTPDEMQHAATDSGYSSKFPSGECSAK